MNIAEGIRATLLAMRQEEVEDPPQTIGGSLERLLPGGEDIYAALMKGAEMELAMKAATFGDTRLALLGTCLTFYQLGLRMAKAEAMNEALEMEG